MNPKTSETRRLGAALGWIQRLMLPVLLVVELILFALISPNFLTIGNLANIVVNAADIGFVAAGLTLVILMGGIDVSTGYAVGLTGWFIATAMAAGTNPWLVLLLGIAVGIVLITGNGTLTAVFGIPSIVATLGTSSIFLALLFVLWDRRDVFSPAIFPWLSGQQRVAGIPVVFIVMVLIFILLELWLRRTRTGQYMYAIGSNSEAASLAGIPIRRVRLLGYAIMGALLGVAAAVHVGKVGVIQATSGGEVTMLAIAAVVVGGTSILGGEGSVLRTLGGLLFIGILRNGVVLAGVPPLWNGVMIGAIILFAVTVNVLAQRYAEGNAA